MMGFQPTLTNFLLYLAVLLLTNMVATTMCLTISTIVPSIAVGNLFAVLLLLLFMMFGGFVISNMGMPNYVSWIRYLSFFNYAVEILAINEFSGLIVMFNPQGFSPVPLNGAQVLQYFGFNPEGLSKDIIGLCVCLAVYLVLSLVLLRFAVREKR